MQQYHDEKGVKALAEKERFESKALIRITGQLENNQVASPKEIY